MKLPTRRALGKCDSPPGVAATRPGRPPRVAGRRDAAHTADLPAWRGGETLRARPTSRRSGEARYRADSIASLVSIAMNTSSTRAAAYSAHHQPAIRLRPAPTSVAAARYAQVIVSAM